MIKPKIKVGHYYEFKLRKKQTIAFAVLYGFERGKNKDVYTLRIFTHPGSFEFPIVKSTFEKWVKEGRVKEINSDEALAYAI